MKVHRIAIVLTGINVLVLLLLLSRSGAVETQSATSALRARAIELVDDAGQIRAQLNVESNGETVFRLRDAKGTIRVKIGGSEEGSGLLLLDETTEPGVHILTKRTGTSITLRKGGVERVIKP
jgi:hypothetical protein